MKVSGWVWVWASEGAAAPQGMGAGTRLPSAHGSAQPGLGALQDAWLLQKMSNVFFRALKKNAVLDVSAGRKQFSLCV